jgi:peptidoglycan hydrolase-like protein with peptidoglycan-binding domain
MRFQGSRGLKVDGVVGSRTWQELLKQVAAGESKGAASRPKPEPEQPPEPTKDDAVEVLLGSDDIEVLRKAWEVIGRILPEGEE